MKPIAERDWKRLRKLKPELLEQACGDILQSVKALIETPGKGRHEAYLELWRLLDEEDKRIGVMFDDHTRSQAIFKIAVLYRNGLITETMLEEFSEETREMVRYITRDD